MTDERPDRPTADAPDDDAPTAGALPPSHLHPRTRDGWIATITWIVLFALCMPPFTHAVLDRPDTWVAGVPFLFVSLLAIYTGLIVVLLWALRRGV
jgi:hypothetical protein